MRTSCSWGTSSGTAAVSAGPWKACAAARTKSSASKSHGSSKPPRKSSASASENSPATPSAASMTNLRLKRSAATPPSGLSNATGSREDADASESHTAEDVVSVMYQMAAKLAAQVANTETA